MENNKNLSGVFSSFNWIRFVEVTTGREPREEGGNGKKELQQEESF